MEKKTAKNPWLLPITGIALELLAVPVCLLLVYLGARISLLGFLLAIGLMAPETMPVTGMILGIIGIMQLKSFRLPRALSIAAAALPPVVIAVLAVLLSTGVVRISLM